ncbi:MAG TPA: polysaccharide biosynthesis/export family protein, partial [Candidatus Acidoferrales bacterium]|nr:polysaccharide biosynthesis/export family protein [Candidatus Acidoferrales bacterium]
MARRILASVLSLLLTAAPLLAAQNPAAPAKPAEPARNYVIGPGDLLGITVYDAPDLSRDVRVSASGVILLPLIPQPVQADGLTPEELAMSLAREFEERQILRNPQITVLVKEYKSRPVAVLGAVK